MKNQKINGSSFLQWYDEIAKEKGPLISASMAARMLETSRQYIDKLVDTAKINRYEYNGMKFISLNEIKNEIIKRQNKKIKKYEQDPRWKRVTYIQAKQEKEEDIKEAIKICEEAYKIGKELETSKGETP